MSPAPPTSLDLTRDIRDDTIPENQTVTSKHATTNNSTGRPTLHSRTTSESLFEEEVRAREHAKHNALYLILINEISAMIVFALHLFSFESLLSIGLSVGFTMLIYYHTEDNGTFDGSAMNWVLLSFAVITPLAAAVTMAFKRREQALFNIATMRTTAIELYAAHSVWDWGWKPNGTGRELSAVDWLDHTDKVLVQLFGICEELSRWLTLPNATRARHKVTKSGRNEALETRAVGGKLYESVILRFGHLADLCEILKQEGLPPNEATRVRQWERFLLVAVENLRMIKMYRTPQGLRSFARLFSVFLPPFYAPFYAQLARDLNSIGMAVAFATITSLALTSLFETEAQMEDPFVDLSVLDGVCVKRELMDEFKPLLLAMRKHCYPSAREFQQAGSDHRVQSQVSAVRLWSE
jgi:hypothetical protein